MGGIIGASAERNPDFYEDHHVHIAYCDGASLSSGRSEPVAVPPNRYHNGSLYFRGRANIDAVIMKKCWGWNSRGLASFVVLRLIIKTVFCQDRLGTEIAWN